MCESVFVYLSVCVNVPFAPHGLTYFGVNSSNNRYQQGIQLILCACVGSNNQFCDFIITCQCFFLQINFILFYKFIFCLIWRGWKKDYVFQGKMFTFISQCVRVCMCVVSEFLLPVQLLFSSITKTLKYFLLFAHKSKASSVAV